MNGILFYNKAAIKMITILIAIVLLISPGFSQITIANNNEEEKMNYYFIKFDQQLNKNGLKNFEASDLEFGYYYQDKTYLVKVNENIINDLLTSNCVLSIEQYQPKHKIHPDIIDKFGEIKIKIVLHEDSDIIETQEKLNNLGIQIEKINEISQKYFICYMNTTDLDKIASIKDVYWIEESHNPITFMNNVTANGYIGIDTVQVGGYRGDGILAEVQDNGIDRTQGDFGQIIYTDGTITAGAHGTCTSGIVFGNGSGDMNAQGIAYEATGAFCDWGVGRANSIFNLWNGIFNEGNAGMNGTVQSNSWGNGALNGEYNANSAEIDQAAVDFPHVLMAWAAGNSNDGTGLINTTQDSSAKNVICVGAVFHNNTITLNDDEWRNAGMGASPSRGPAADGRQKPDLCGPFDWVYTTDAIVFTSDTWQDGYVVGSAYYDDFGGTSAATPVIAGCSVLTYDMYQDNFFGNNPTGDWPFSCTVKALLIADAYQYPITRVDRNVQGWGTPDMEYMYTLNKTYHVIEEYPESLDSGNVWSRSFYVDGTHPLKSTLTWIDPAAPASTGSSRALINNLDLKIESPSGTIYWGNNGLDNNLWSSSGTGTNHWSTISDHRDDLNNIENVFIQSPEEGFWTVEVIGRTGGVPQGPQDFSLVLSGAIDRDFFGYTYIDSNSPGGPSYNWIEISDNGNQILPSSDDSWVVDINLGFFFNYYGTDYSQMAIGNNGLMFSGEGTWQYINQPITQTPGVHGFIAPYWDDIVTWGSADAIYYKTIGTAPNRMFVVEWNNNQHYYSSTSGITFEAILYEGTNNILFQYEDVDFGTVSGAVSGDNPPYNNGGSATVGIEDPSGNIGLQYSFNQQVIAPGLAILFKFPAFSGANMFLSMNAPASMDHGNTMTYSLYYNDFGSVEASDVVLQATLSSDVDFISASDGGTYDSDTRTATWDIGTVPPYPDGRGSRTITVEIPSSVPVGTIIQSTASISTTTLETRYDDNDASAQTTVTGSNLPPNVGVSPTLGNSGGDSVVYWHTPITFSYYSDCATAVEIIIHINDGGPDIVGSMTETIPNTWTYTISFSRYGTATITYNIEGCTVDSVSFNIYIDPAGYIYNIETGERIEGASVWLQRPDGTGEWENVTTGESPPVMIPDINPQITGADGQYQWDVIAGTYRVHVEATGYLPADSIVVNIPPPVTDLHVGLIPIDTEPPTISIVSPSIGDALQDGVTIETIVSDPSGVDWVTYSIRYSNGGTGEIIDPSFESLNAVNIGDDTWQLPFDTTQLPDGFYVLLVNASDLLGNEGYETVEFSIRNWAVVELLPSTPKSKAGRTMPIKFSIRVTEAVDPAEPFVWNENLTILIYEEGHPEDILQESTYGDTSKDYRISSEGEHYITNFKTSKKPKTYVVEIWRNDMLLDSFEFETVK